MSDDNLDPEDRGEPLDGVLAAWADALPGVDLTSISVSISISRLAAQFNRAMEDLVRPYNFGYGELEVLFFLLSTGKPYEMRPSDLTRGCFVTSGAITGRVDRLTKLGLVSRIPSLIDRRETVIRLTRDGEKIARRLRSIIACDSPLTAALADFPPEHRAALDRTLRQLMRKLDDLGAQRLEPQSRLRKQTS